MQPTGESESGRAEVALFMPAWRAADLSRVMDAYSRMAAIFTSISEVSGTESSWDGCLLRTGRRPAPGHPQPGSKR